MDIFVRLAQNITKANKNVTNYCYIIITTNHDYYSNAAQPLHIPDNILYIWRA